MTTFKNKNISREFFFNGLSFTKNYCVNKAKDTTELIYSTAKLGYQKLNANLFTTS